MQPEARNLATHELARNSLVAARAAWLRGDFKACLERLGSDRGAFATDGRGEALLLHARVLLRTEHSAEAVELLQHAIPALEDKNERGFAIVLHAAAVARSDRERGVQLLISAASETERLGVNRTIRAEVAYYRALACWQMRDFAGATNFALAAEAWHADVVSVRALSLRGFVAIAKHRYAEALELFRFAAAAYAACSEHDGDLAAQIELQVASLELTLLSREVPGSHTLPDARRIANGSFARSVATATRMQIRALDAWLSAHDGEAERALELMQAAEDLAPTPAWRVWALAGRAAVASAFGETKSAYGHARAAQRIAENVDWESTFGEERVSLLLLAEVLAAIAPEEAATYFQRYDSVTSSMAPLSALRDDPRLAALHDHVGGLVSRIRGETQHALQLLQNAYRTFRECGNLWRSALSLIELDATSYLVRGSAPLAGRFYLDEATTIVQENFPRSFLARRLGMWSNVQRDPVARSLTPTQREVLRHLLGGKVQKEIATSTGRAYGTIRNHVAALLDAFGAHSIPELIIACYERGLGAPTWRSDEDVPPPTAAEASSSLEAAN